MNSPDKSPLKKDSLPHPFRQKGDAVDLKRCLRSTTRQKMMPVLCGANDQLSTLKIR
jgi:hypothetical protein